MNFCGQIKKNRAKRMVPAVYMGLLRCEIPESGDEFTMYSINIPNWADYPVSILRAAEGFYRIQGAMVAVEAILSTQRPAKWKTKHVYWRMNASYKLKRFFTGKRS